jgi:hypothetical protein
MSDTTILSLTPSSLRQVLQEAGYRAEAFTDPMGVPRLGSATGGLPFEIRFGNRIPGDAEVYADVTFIAALRVQGVLSLDIVNTWNNTKRFARLHLNQDHLFLDMDVTVLGGVSVAHLRTQVQLWDRLVQELLHYLRNAADKIAAANNPGQGSAEAERRPSQAPVPGSTSLN